MWGSSPADVYAVGDRGTILHTQDGGRSWSLENSGTTANLYAVWGSGADDVFAVGYDGTILHSTDGGTSWAPQDSAEQKNLAAIWGSSKRDVYILEVTGDVLHSTDSVKTWTPRKPRADHAQQFSGIWGRGKGDVYVVGYDEVGDDCTGGECASVTSRGMVIHTTDAGKTWEHESMTSLPHAIWGIGPHHRYLVSSNERETQDTLHHVDDDAASVDQTPLDTYLFAIWASGTTNVFAVGQRGTILHSADSQKWKPQSSGASHNLRAVWGSGADVFVVGDYGTILHSSASGASWSVQGAATAKDLRAVWGTAGGDVLAVGDDGVIVRRTASGSTWAVEASGTTQGLVAVWGSGKDDVFVVGRAGAILHSTGRSWKPQTSGVTRLAAIWGSGKGDVFVVGGDGTILHTTDSGGTWTNQRSGTKEDLTAIWGSGKDDVYAVGRKGAILHSADSGQNWTRLPDVVKPALMGFDTFGAIWGSSADDVFIVGHRGVVHGTDGGKSWQVEDTDDRDGKPTAVWGSGKDVYIMANRVQPIAHGPFLDGAILHSTDGGKRWTHTPRPDRGTETWGTGLLAIWGSDDTNIFVVGWAGTILRYGS